MIRGDNGLRGRSSLSEVTDCCRERGGPKLKHEHQGLGIQAAAGSSTHMVGASRVPGWRCACCLQGTPTLVEEGATDIRAVTSDRGLLTVTASQGWRQAFWAAEHGWSLRQGYGEAGYMTKSPAQGREGRFTQAGEERQRWDEVGGVGQGPGPREPGQKAASYPKGDSGAPAHL